MDASEQIKNANGFSIRDVFIFTAIVALATALYVDHNPLGCFPFMAAIYFAAWRLLNTNTSRIKRIVMMAFLVALISPLLLWQSSPETRAFNIRIGYQWDGSYLYPFFWMLPVPFLFFVWKCYRPKLTIRRFLIESFFECFLAIPLYTLFIVGI